MKFRIIYLIIFFSLAAGILHAQEWQDAVKDPSNFFSIQKAYYDEELKNKQPGVAEDGINEIYERWANFTQPRVYPDGKPFDPGIIYKAWDDYVKGNSRRPALNKQAVWQYAGPVSTPINGGGTGRINCIRFNPKNPNIVWAGTPAGGLWKSTNGGMNWATNTDTLPNLGISDIAIDPLNTDTMYIATGDGYGYAYNNGNFFGGYYSNGLMKSIDGGNSFFATTLNWSQTQSRQIFKLLVHPQSSNLIFAATNSGLWRSKDWGANWTQVQNGAYFDIKLNPGNPAIMYLSGSGISYSNDTGKTWTASTNYPSGYNSLVLAVTPAAPKNVYALALYSSNGLASLYKSYDEGKDWTIIRTIPNDTFYGKYTSGFAVAPNDSNRIVVGGIKIKESNDGGLSWRELGTTGFPSQNYVHPDHRALEFYPGAPDTLFDGNDGGIYFGLRSPILQTYSWSIISSDIHTLQSYGVATANSLPGRFFTGAQDNGINRRTTTDWNHVRGGDGMLCAVNNDNPDIVFANNQYGYMNKSINGGLTFGYYPVNPPAPIYSPFNWVAPVFIDPANQNKIYFGGDDLYVSSNNANSWKALNVDSRTIINIGKIAVGRFKDNYIYTVKQSDYLPNTVHLYVSSNSGSTWTDISKGLPSGYAYISGIAIDKSNPLKVWVTFSGFSSGKKVYYSFNGGKNWINASNNLPNVPIDCIALEGSTENGTYIGTDIGVFYRNDNDTNWVRYSDGLPNVIVTELEVLPSINKIRASTFGRGIWDGDIAGTISGLEKINAISDAINVYPNPTSGSLHISLPDQQGKTPLISVYNMQGQKVYELPSSTSSGNAITIDLSTYAKGIYTLIFNYNGQNVVKKVLVQ